MRAWVASWSTQDQWCRGLLSHSYPPHPAPSSLPAPAASSFSRPVPAAVGPGQRREGAWGTFPPLLPWLLKGTASALEVSVEKSKANQLQRFYVPRNCPAGHCRWGHVLGSQG